MKSTDQEKDPDNIGNISGYLRLNAEKHPDKPAILYPEVISYEEMETRVNRYAYRLEYKGIKPGTRTILMVPVGLDFFVLTFALLRIGAIPVMIDPGMGFRAMAKALGDLQPEAFIGIPKAHLLHFFYPGIFKSVKTSISIGFQWLSGARMPDNPRNDNTGQYPSYPVDPNSIAAIFFTSGSTGPAKGVIYTAGMLLKQIQVTKSHFNIGSDETDLCTFPLLGLFAICHGNSSVIADMNMIHPATMNPAKVIRNIQDFGCTQMFGSPMILKKLSRYGTEKGARIPSLRHVISAGAPVHRDILESFSKMLSDKAIIHTPYGATEGLPVTDITSSELLMTNSDDTKNETGICVGYPIEGLNVKIIAISDDPIVSWDDAKQISSNEVGEITAKGPWIATEYINNSDANRLSKIHDLLTDEIWHRMGDLGKMDLNGRIWFYGRKSQRVITKDSTLFTIPCEAVYKRHPSVERAALVGVPSKESGTKRAVICIQLKPGCRPTVKLVGELDDIGQSSELTKGITDILFHKKFPVDPRHNAKIFREKLAKWAERRIK